MTQCTVAVLGAGNGGKAMAADLTLRGFLVRLYDRYPSAVADVQERSGIYLHGSERDGFAGIQMATCDLRVAVDGADILVIVVPAPAHEYLVDQLVPHLADGQTVLFTPGYLGSILLRRRLQQSRPELTIQVGETCSLPYACRLIGPAEVGLRGIKRVLDVAAVPATHTADLIERLKPLFPSLAPAQNVLEAALNNPNPISHVPTCLLNFGRIDQPRTTDWHDFEEWVTPKIHTIQLRLDQERLAILSALKLTGLDMERWSERAYGGRPKDRIQTKGNIPSNAMAVPERYITEDVPMGLVPLEALGRLNGLPVPITTMLITLANELYGKDFRIEGRHLGVLGWDGLTPGQILSQVG
jgi:opine dehydrogenase